ncbi:MAG TPA: arsenical-resistance protein, partial [Thermoplasmata archaeon]|nr:arsenical-resistance protein [Thermoplasmata archaeon]
MADAERFSLFDRLTTLWIFLAMALGVGLGALVPGLPGRLDAFSWGGV